MILASGAENENNRELLKYVHRNEHKIETEDVHELATTHEHEIETEFDL